MDIERAASCIAQFNDPAFGLEGADRVLVERLHHALHAFAEFGARRHSCSGVPKQVLDTGLKKLDRPTRNGPRIAPRDFSLVIAEESCLLAGAEIAFAKSAAVKPLLPALP